MTTLHTFSSGSSGNAAVLSCGDTHLLIDAGISCRRITAALVQLGLTPASLTAILITHTHTDHISGLAVLAKRAACPVAATPGACRELARRLPELAERLLPVSGPVMLGEVEAVPVPTSHDAPGSCGWRFNTADGGVGFLTDTGCITDEAAALLPGVALAVLEANHDIEALRSGPYPYYLKERILSPRGHLCNADAAAFAVTLARAGAAEIVLAHLSRDNNTPAMALNAVESALSAAGLAPALSVAPRDVPGPCHSVSADRGCLCSG